MRVTICTANCVGQAGNCNYPNRVTVVTPEQLQEAVKKDHVCAEFKGNYRSVENFIRSDVIVMDYDNDTRTNLWNGLRLRSWKSCFRMWNTCWHRAATIF